MREIQYQGWNGKQMLQVVCIHLDADGAIWWSNDFKQLKIYNAEHCPMRQYTGLKDKNGKEIYEGDIVKSEGMGLIQYAMGEVVWKEIDTHGAHEPDPFCWNVVGYYQTEQGRDPIDQPIYDGTDEVIGNIYENPELL